MLLLPCVKTLLKGFDSHRDDGSDVMTYKESPKCQPQGFRLEQIMANALDPRYTMLYGVPDTYVVLWHSPEADTATTRN